MKRLLLICLLGLSLTYVSAQSSKAHKTTHATAKRDTAGSWQKQLYRSWKIVNISSNTMGGELGDILKRQEENAYITLSANSHFIAGVQRYIISDKFFTFEHNKKQYLSVAGLVFTINKLNSDFMEISFETIMPKRTRLSISLAANTDESESAARSILVNNNWEHTPGEDNVYRKHRYTGESTPTLQKEFYRFSADGSFSCYTDSTIERGTWSLDSKEMLLSLNAKSGKKKYAIHVLSSASIDCSAAGDEEHTIRFSKSWETPEQMQKQAEARKEERQKLAKRQADDNASSDYNGLDAVEAAPSVVEAESAPIAIEMPPAPTKSLQAQLAGEWKASRITDYIRSQELPVEKPVTFNLKADSTYSLQNGKKTIKGRWSVSPDNRALLLEIKGQQFYCPFTKDYTYGGSSSSVHRDVQKFHLSVSLPGEKKMKVITFVPIE